MTTVGFTTELSHTRRASNAVRAGVAARSYSKNEIARELSALRKMLHHFVSALSDDMFLPPVIPTVNPPLWEAAHMAWFAEWFCVRGAHNTTDGDTRANLPSTWTDSDAFLNSNLISHRARWHLPQLTRPTVLDYLDRSLELTLRALDRAEDSDGGLYRFRLAMFHEAMHLEAIAWAAQTLAWEMPLWVGDIQPEVELSLDNNITSNRPIAVGANVRKSNFQFDNEIGFMPNSVGVSTIKAVLISNADFASFVDSGEHETLTGREHPVYWRQNDFGAWEQRRFDRWIALNPNDPVIHVNAFEAEAFAAWADARLPTEDELHSHFNSSDASANWHGALWEWTSSAFSPPKNFTPGVYREYSQPWFDGKHRVLRGGSFATLPIMHHPHYRNFFLPERNDIFAGFRIVSGGGASE